MIGGLGELASKVDMASTNWVEIKARLVPIALVIVILRVNAIRIHKQGWISGRTIWSKNEQRMGDNEMNEYELGPGHPGEHLHIIQDQFGALAIALPVDLIEIDQACILQDGEAGWYE